MVSFGVLSTFPPTECGIATFSESLCGGLSDIGVDVRKANVENWKNATDQLKAADVALIEHEYGIFPGMDGETVLDVVEELEQPTIVTCHTVLTNPTTGQFKVLSSLLAEADTAVTMTEIGKSRLINIWGVDHNKIQVIPHGAPVVPLVAKPWDGNSFNFLTWGLIGPGKGLEWAISALGTVKRRNPGTNFTYRIVGKTHPKVRAREGEQYRNLLKKLAKACGVEDNIVFDDRYLSSEQLWNYVKNADLVLLPYDSSEQVTSGVLTEAVAGGKPVVSTAFPHAVELLSSGAGLLVKQKDPGGLAQTLTYLVRNPDVLEIMAEKSQELANQLHWPNIAAQYVHLAEKLKNKHPVRRPAW